MSSLLIDIGEIVVETESERARVESAAPAIAEAFRLLGQRLERTPAVEIAAARLRAIELLKTTALPLDELLSSRGAERLADDMYRRLIRSGS